MSIATGFEAKTNSDNTPIQTDAAGLDLADLRRAVSHHVRYTLGKSETPLTARDLFFALSRAVRDRGVDAMLATNARYQQAGAKCLYYLSLEFLMGRTLGNNLINLGMDDLARELANEFHISLDDIIEQEPDAALGNGGLGRLAACFLDSLATLGMPGFGCGINYEYGLFRQDISNGYQQEKPDNWLAHGTPWQIQRPEEAVIVPVYGRVEHARDREGRYNPMWLDWKVLIGVPHDMPVVGYGGKTVNYLRLYSARSSRDFDMHIFNDGDYLRAVEQKMMSETVSKVLYPSDAILAGRELRLIQEYFLVACAVREVMRRHLPRGTDVTKLPERVAIQLNDTHPALTVAELMRVLVDENDVPWDQAWEVTQATLGYTNHTLLPEALEKWPVSLLEYVLPRHLQIIYEINHRFLELVRSIWPLDHGRAQRMSIIEEGEPKQVRMANLAIVGSRSVNGVAALHSDLIKSTLVPDFYALWPERFNNKTNGVTQRRWLLKSNPRLATLVTEVVGDSWITNLTRLRNLEAFASDSAFQDRFHQVKQDNKIDLAKLVKETTQVTVDPQAIFDVQIKRIHEYKRQLLNVLHVIHLYLRIVDEGLQPAAARVFLFGGKAAPGYWAAKQIIKLVNNVAQVINSDRRVKEWLRVAFLPDYRVSLAERVIPAANLSEQISTAGMEASGTGNMKFALNGALTMGTLDGANIEIMEEVGADNIFIFGLKAHEVAELKRLHSYKPWEYYKSRESVRKVMDTFQADRFCPREPNLFKWIWHALLDQGDRYFLLADLDAYIEAQQRAELLYTQPTEWNRKAILNVARVGKFSSDRTISQYAEDIWRIRPVL